MVTQDRVKRRPLEDGPRLIPLVADVSLLLDGVTDVDGMARAGGAAFQLSEYAQDHLDAVRGRPSAERSGLLAVLGDAIDARELITEEAIALSSSSSRRAPRPRAA